MATPYKDQKAILANLLLGKALPDHLAKKPGGQVVQRSKHVTGEDGALEARIFRDEIAKKIAAKMPHAPIVALSHFHTCTCGNQWAGSFSFAKVVTQRIEGEADLTALAAIDYIPRPEEISRTEWKEVKEPICARCYGGPIAPNTPKPAREEAPVVVLEQYRHKAAEEVDAIREEAINQRRAAYVASAVKRVSSVLPYGLEDAIPALPEMVYQAKVAGEAE